MGDMEMKLPSGYTIVFHDDGRDVSTDLVCDACNAYRPKKGGKSVMVRGIAGYKGDRPYDIDQLAVWICESCHIANSR